MSKKRRLNKNAKLALESLTRFENTYRPYLYYGFHRCTFCDTPYRDENDVSTNTPCLFCEGKGSKAIELNNQIGELLEIATENKDIDTLNRIEKSCRTGYHQLEAARRIRWIREGK